MNERNHELSMSIPTRSYSLHQYGRLWAVKAHFSAIKGIFDETVRASSIEGMISEIVRLFILYTIIIND
jgi:hypothetical protein